MEMAMSLGSNMEWALLTIDNVFGELRMAGRADLEIGE
jgi:hypothetical protein